MRSALDSFLKYLVENLPGLSINYLRHDPNDQSAGLLKMNSLNVHVLDVEPTIQGSVIRVSLDAVYDSETTAWTNLGLIHDLFKKSYYTPMLDYTVPASPVDMDKNVYWDSQAVRFSRVVSDNYCHYSCVLALKYA